MTIFYATTKALIILQGNTTLIMEFMDDPLKFFLVDSHNVATFAGLVLNSHLLSEVLNGSNSFVLQGFCGIPTGL